MNDRSVRPAEFYANEVQPRKISMQDMTGGGEIGGDEVETTNAKPIAILRKEEPSLKLIRPKKYVLKGILLGPNSR